MMQLDVVGRTNERILTGEWACPASSVARAHGRRICPPGWPFVNGDPCQRAADFRSRSCAGGARPVSLGVCVQDHPTFASCAHASSSDSHGLSPLLHANRKEVVLRHGAPRFRDVNRIFNQQIKSRNSAISAVSANSGPELTPCRDRASTTAAHRRQNR